MTTAGFFDALHFLRPYWLWALVLVPLVAWAWQRRLGGGQAWRQVVDAHLLPHLLDQAPRKRLRRWWPAVLAGIATALAVLALAGPSWTRSAQPLWQVRTPLVIALDLSGAVAAADLPPSRLAQARAKLGELLARRDGGDVGMLVYADEPYVVAPLTSDARNVALFLDALSPDIMPGDGDGPSRADRAIEMAASLLRQAGHRQGDIVLLEDAAGDDALRAAREASAAGFRVSVLGLGTTAGAAWRDSGGGIRRASLDAASLRKLASAGRGTFVPLQEDGALATLQLLEPRQGTGQAAGGKARLWLDQGYWLLLPLLLLVPFAFRRGGVFALFVACLVLPWPGARAAGLDGDVAGGFADLWQRPDQQAHARLREGAQAYRAGDFQGALQAWEGLPGATAAYNRGNALARLGRFPEAIQAYDRALQLQPGMADARANREAVRDAMKRQSPQDGKGHEQQGKTGGEQQARPQPGPVPGKQEDAGRQAAADAAQRRRMRQGDQGQPVQGPDPDESTREREQRLANEAALRRVPDDPGGLLRARFQLEHQRRREQER